MGVAFQCLTGTDVAAFRGAAVLGEGLARFFDAIIGKNHSGGPKNNPAPNPFTDAPKTVRAFTLLGPIHLLGQHSG